MQALGGLVGELDDVGTGREGSIAGAGQDDDPDPIVEVERLELGGQLGEEREAERVARLGSIDRDERDAVMPGDGGIDTDQAGGRLDVGHGLLAGRPVKYPRSGPRATTEDSFRVSPWPPVSCPGPDTDPARPCRASRSRTGA